ncbi:MAG: glycosyltransferase family 4 protein [Candidatus Edwardsbacteria bacterium]|nr:glycosyltransferase family 4 protein [Candidatus Edwardsbacteria bacterium]
MKVLHLVTAFPRDEKDIITPWLIEMLRHYPAHGLEAEIFTSSYQGLGEQMVHGLPVHRFRYFFKRWENLTHEETTPDRMKRSLLYKIMPAFYIIGGMIGIVKLLRKNRYDAVHVHWPLPHAVFGWAAKTFFGLPVVTTFYGVELRWVKRSMPLLKGFLAWSARMSDKVVAISNCTAGEVRELADVPVEVIPYTISLPENREFSQPPAGPRIILSVSRLVERKGIIYLIDALKYLPQEMEVHLAIIGDGPERDRLKERALSQNLGRKISLPGWVSEAELESAYRNASVFVLPAIIDSKGDTEGLGVVILEAMNYKVPVIGSDLGGITDIIMDEETGLLVPEKDPQALARAITRILTDEDLRTKITEGAYQHLKHNFSWDNILQKWVRVYKSLE